MVKFQLSKKKTNYLRLIRILILNDKKIAMISTFSLIVGFVFLFIFSALSGTIVQTNQENLINTYGKFLVVVPEVDKETEKEISKLDSHFVCEYYGIVANTKYANTKIKIGTMEEAMCENLGLKKIKGHWPENSHQIVVEEYLLELFEIENKPLPTSVTMQVNGQNICYEVTGVISNYSHFLSSTIDDTYKYKVYPSIICGKKGATITAQSVVILQKKLNFESAEDDIWYVLDQISTDTVCGNHHLESGYAENADIMTARWIYILLVNILLLFSQILILKTFFVRNSKTLALFSALGISNKKKARIFFGWIVSILFVSLLLGVVFSFLIGCTILQQIFEAHNAYYVQSLVKQFWIESGLLSIILLISIVFYKNYNGVAISKGLIPFSVKLEKKYTFKKFSVGIAMIQSVCILFATASFCFADSFKLETEAPNYDLYSSETDSYYKLNNYSIALNEKNPFPLDVLKELDKYEDFVRASAQAETKNSTILLQKEQITSYLKQYLSEHKKLSSKDKTLWKQVSKKAKQYNAIDPENLVIDVLSQKSFQSFLKENNVEEAGIKDASELSCVLQLPDYDKSSSDLSIKEHDTILLGGLQGNDQKVEFCTEEFKVASIISTDEDEDSSIHIIIGQDIAEASSLVLGYDSIHIELSKDAPSSVQKGIEQRIASWMASTQGGMLDSSVQRNAKTLLLRKYTSILSNTMLFFGVFSIWIYISLTIYIEWKQNCYEYGVLRSFGMSYATLQRNLFARYRNSLLCSSIVSCILALVIFQYNDVSIDKIIFATGISVVATYVCRILVYWKNRKESIRSMINNDVV